MARDTILIGVTGHRFLAEVEKLQEAVGRALDQVTAWAAGKRLVALSPLAEGADRLVAQAILQRGGGLIVPLPLKIDDYRQDFDTPKSMSEFEALLERAEQIISLPPAQTRNAAYEQVGDYIADHADALVTLWDGQGVQGQGGTAGVVRRALERGIPVLHVKTGNRRPGANEPTTAGPEQGKLMIHNLAE